jgi:hypothetical protein
VGWVTYRGRWGTFGVAHMHNIMARMKGTILAHIVLVGTPEGKVRTGRKVDG